MRDVHRRRSTGDDDCVVDHALSVVVPAEARRAQCAVAQRLEADVVLVVTGEDKGAPVGVEGGGVDACLLFDNAEADSNLRTDFGWRQVSRSIEIGVGLRLTPVFEVDARPGQQAFTLADGETVALSDRYGTIDQLAGRFVVKKLASSPRRTTKRHHLSFGGVGSIGCGGLLGKRLSLAPTPCWLACRKSIAGHRPMEE
jgi:hypothetical protein